MNIKKQFFVSILLIFSMSFFCSMHKSTQINWIEKMSRDSQLLLGQLAEVEKEINDKNPEFYDKEKELKIAQDEFKKEELKNFAQEINETMKTVVFEIEQTSDNFDYIITKEFIDYMKEGGNTEDSGIFYKNFMKHIGTFGQKYPDNLGAEKIERFKKIFKEGLLEYLKIKFRNNKTELEFIDKYLSKETFNYDFIKELIENEKVQSEVKDLLRKNWGKMGSYSKKYKMLMEGNHDKEMGLYIVDLLKNTFSFPYKQIKKEVMEDIAQNINYLCKNNVKNKYGITIEFWCPEKYNNNFKNKIIKRALSQILASKKIYPDIVDMNSPIVQSADLYVFPSSVKKTFPTKIGGIFTPANVNSAEAGPTIFRKEELLKLILHEFNHRIGFNINFDDKNITQNHKELPVAGDRNAADAPIEALASITNIIMTACEISPDNYLQIAPQLLEREKLFAIYQTAKILYLSNFDNFEQFYNPTENGPKINQKTAVAEYYILKTVLLQDISEFLKIYKEKDKLERKNKLEQLILKNMPNPDLANKINTIIKAFKEKTIATDPENFLFKTGRMTIIEPSLD